MAYIGQSPITGIFKKQSLTTDGSTTSFDLDFTVASTTSIIVSVGGVVQEPETAYVLGGGGCCCSGQNGDGGIQIRYRAY